MNDRSGGEVPVAGSTPEHGPMAEPAPGAMAEPAPGADRAGNRPDREPGGLVIPLSPQQIIGGFAMLAALILMLKRRGRSKGKG
jgi:hypothetical protein